MPAPKSTAQLRLIWLEVEGFRRFQSRRFFDFRDPSGAPLHVVVLAGTNGSGKTTLLEAILFGLGQESLIVRDVVKDRKKHWRGQLPQGARISLCVQFEGQYLRADRTGKAHLWKVVTDPFDVPTNPSEISFGPPASLVEYFSAWRSPALTGPVWPTTDSAAVVETEGARLRTLKQRLVDQRTLESYAGNDTAGGTHRAWLDAINRAWTILHGADGSRLVDQPTTPGATKAGFDLFVVEATGERRCSVDHLSGGEIELVTLAGALVTREPPQIVLIDEPELHLHPQWQAQIIPALQALAPHAQFIASTHADAPWDRAPSYSRFFLGQDGDPRASFGTQLTKRVS